MQFSQWSGNGLVSYYLNLILETVGIQATSTKTLINGLLQLFNFAMALTSALLVERIGRRGLFIASNAGMLAGWSFPSGQLPSSDSLGIPEKAFIVWTVTSALFQETGSKVAANMTIVMIVSPLYLLAAPGLLIYFFSSSTMRSTISPTLLYSSLTRLKSCPSGCELKGSRSW